MTIKMQKTKLTKRQNSLQNELSDIQREIVVLLTLQRNAAKEIEEIKTKLGEFEESETISHAYTN